MLRRVIFFAALIYTVVHVSKSRAKQAGGQPNATDRWESEGGAPASEPAQ